jgi:hypothetical protein
VFHVGILNQWQGGNPPQPVHNQDNLDHIIESGTPVISILKLTGLPLFDGKHIGLHERTSVYVTGFLRSLEGSSLINMQTHLISKCQRGGKETIVYPIMGTNTHMTAASTHVNMMFRRRLLTGESQLGGNLAVVDKSARNKHTNTTQLMARKSARLRTSLSRSHPIHTTNPTLKKVET